MCDGNFHLKTPGALPSQNIVLVVYWFLKPEGIGKVQPKRFLIQVLVLHISMMTFILVEIENYRW